jgi:hypothetical protein
MAKPMTLDNVLKLMADSAAVAQKREGMPQSENLALGVIRWAPRYIVEQSRGYAAGAVMATFAMSMHVKPKLDPAISTALFVLEQVLKYDGLIPREQVEEAAATLAALGQAKAA